MASRLFTLVTSLLCTGVLSTPLQAAEPIRYTLKFPAPQTHYVEVEATFPPMGDDLVLMLPVWTPGSYLVREYSRHVENLTALSADGNPVAATKVRKNRWALKTRGTAVTLSYRVYCHEMGVQTSWIDAGFALINGASLFLTPVRQGSSPHEVTLVPPPSWKGSYTGLPDAPDGKSHHYLAPDYDTLIDSPIFAGSPKVYEFEVDGKKHLLVNEGEGGVWDGPRSARDVERIVRAQREFWGSLPYDKYVFLNLLTEFGGGLEHKNSTVLMSTRWATRTRKAYLNWLDLVSHEFFHTWNVKRLRPVELGPFDYENEVATKSLWLAEGVTDYYGRLFVRRAGLCTIEEYLAGRPRTRPGTDPDEPFGEIAVLQTTPGRLVQPLESSSYDTWIKFYRRDENTPNTGVDYYNKGAIVGFLLDAKIRAVTGDMKSLDDVMRLAYARYSGTKGYTPAEFRAVACEVAGTDLSAFFQQALETTDELDFSAALDWFGLKFKEEKTAKPGDPVKAWLGLGTKAENGRLLVTQVKRGTPGFDAGLNVGDEIIAIDDDRLRAEVWRDRMEHYRPGDKVSVLISRRDRLMRLEAIFAKEPVKPWGLDVNAKADENRLKHQKAWLGE